MFFSLAIRFPTENFPQDPAKITTTPLQCLLLVLKRRVVNAPPRPPINLRAAKCNTLWHYCTENPIDNQQLPTSLPPLIPHHLSMPPPITNRFSPLLPVLVPQHSNQLQRRPGQRRQSQMNPSVTYCKSGLLVATKKELRGVRSACKNWKAYSTMGRNCISRELLQPPSWGDRGTCAWKAEQRRWKKGEGRCLEYN